MSLSGLVSTTEHRDPNKYLLHGIITNDGQAVSDAIKEGAQVTLADRNCAPILLATYLGHRTVAEILIHHGASFQVANKEGWTAERVAYATNQIVLASLFHASILDNSKSKIQSILVKTNSSSAPEMMRFIQQLKLPKDMKQLDGKLPAKTSFLSQKPSKEKSEKEPMVLEQLNSLISDQTIDPNIKTQLKRIQNLYQQHTVQLNESFGEYTPTVSGLSTEDYLALHQINKKFRISLPLTAEVLDPFSERQDLLHAAIYERDVNVFFYLLAIGAPLNAFNLDGYAPIHIAAKQLKKEREKALLFISALIVCGAEPHKLDERSKSFVEHANGDPVASNLFGHDKLGLDLSPLSEYVQKALLDYVPYLPIESLALCNSPYITNEVVANFNRKLKKLSLQGCASITSQGILSLNTFCQNLSVTVGNCKNISANEYYTLMLELKDFSISLSDCSTINCQNLTPFDLHHTIYAGDKDAFLALLAYGAVVDEQDENGQSPLHCAVNLGDEKLTDAQFFITALVLCGASIQSHNELGITPLQIAFDNGNTQLFDFIQKLREPKEVLSQAKKLIAEKWPTRLEFKDLCEPFENKMDLPIDSLPPQGQLFRAIVSNDVELALLALRNGAQLVNDSHNNSPLHLAASIGHYKISQFLITKGLDIQAYNSEGQTPLDLARAQRHLSIIHDMETRLFETLIQNIQMSLTDCTEADKKNIQNLLEQLDAPNIHLSLKAKSRGPNKAVLAISEMEKAVNDPIVKDRLIDIKQLFIDHIATCTGKAKDCAITLKNYSTRDLLTFSSYCHQFHIRLETNEILKIGLASSNPLHEAIASADEGVFYFLLERGGYIAKTDAEGCTPLHYAARKAKKNPEQALLFSAALLNWETHRNKKHLIDAKDIHGETALDKAKSREVEVLINFLINAKHASGIIDWDYLPDQVTKKLLEHILVTKDSMLAFRNCSFLRDEHLEKFASVITINKLTVQGCKNISVQGIIAVLQQCPNAEIVIGRCCNIKARDYFTLTRLGFHFAIQLATGEHLQTNNLSHTAIIQSIQAKDLESFFFLLSYKETVDERDHEGSTPLHWAARTGARFPDLAPILITNLIFCGAQVNPVDNLPETPYYKASMRNDQNTCDFFKTLDHPLRVLSEVDQYYDNWGCQERFKAYWTSFINAASKKNPYLNSFDLPLQIIKDLTLKLIPESQKGYTFDIIRRKCINLLSISLGECNTVTSQHIMSLTGDLPIEQVGLNPAQIETFFGIDEPQTLPEKLDYLTGYQLQRIGFDNAKIFVSFMDLSEHSTSYNEIIPALRKNRQLQGVRLFGNALDRYVLPILQGDPSAPVIDLSSCGFSDNDIESLSLVLQGNETVKELNLSGNDFTVLGLSRLNILLPNTKVYSLNLSKNKINAGAIELLPQALQHLMRLDLSMNFLGSAGLKSLSAMFKNDSTKITHLNLSDNEIRHEPIEELIETLPCTQITHLNLSNNGIRHEPIEELIEALPCTQITHLDLSNNILSKVDVKILAEKIRRSPLKQLKLTDCGIDGSSLPPLLNYTEIEIIF